MFQVSLTQLVEFYLGFVFLAVLLFSLAPRVAGRIRQARRARRIALCPLCGTTHPAPVPGQLVACPSCGRLNEPGRFPV